MLKIIFRESLVREFEGRDLRDYDVLVGGGLN